METTPAAAGRSRFRCTFAHAVLVLLAGVVACGSEPKDSVTGLGGSGAVSVVVAGLPAGAAARVTLTDPSGAAIAVAASGIVTGLVPGAYGVAAQYVNAQGMTWLPQLSATSLTVARHDTVPLQVTYAGSAGPVVNLRVGAVQLIQSTQRADGSVPMIGGRSALLRVFVTADQANSAQPVVRVRLLQGGVVVDSLSLAAPGGAVPQAVDTASLAASWNVLLPAARVLPGLALQAVVDPLDQVPETDESDNVWPAIPGGQAVTVRNVPPLDLRFVPVKQSVNGLTGQVNSGNKDAFAEDTRRMMPVGVVNAAVRATFTTNAPVLVSNDSNGAWSQILSETYALRSADGSNSNYVGIVPVTYGGGIAGLGYIGAPASIGWDKAGSAPGVVAHELGHNFGRLHAPCGGPAGPDQNYPYANASIGTWGLDLPAMQLKPPGTYKDLMSYCSPEWISDYNYLAVLGARGTLPVTSGVPAPAGRGLLVWGRITPGGVILEPAFEVDAPVRLPAAPGPHRLEGFDDGGSRLFSITFQGEAVPDLPGGAERHFAFVLPLTAVERSRLRIMTVEGNGLTAVRRLPAALRGGQATAPLTAVRAGATEVEVRWDPVFPLAVIRDDRTGTILGFGRGGVSRVTAGPGAVRVDLSSGVSSRPGAPLAVP